MLIIILYLILLNDLQDGLPPLQMLDEMQCMWFQTELARAYWRLGCFGEALVKYHEIDKVSVQYYLFIMK